MDEWYDTTQRIGTYPERVRGIRDNIPLVEAATGVLKSNLSPLSNLLLNVSQNSPPTKDVVFAIPETIFRPIPILAYVYAKRNKKSVLVFTGPNNLDIHKKNYYLLNSIEKDGRFLFEDVPIGVNVKEGKIDARLFLPRISDRYYKKKFIAGQLKNFRQPGPKILLSSVSGDTKINSIFEKIKLDGGDELLNQEIDIDLIIFENIERFVNSNFTFSMFLDWTYELSDSVRFVFHSSNPFSKYISELKDTFDAFVLQFGPNLLQNNSELKKASLKYFSSLNREKESLLNKYNVDRPSFYDSITKRRPIPLPVENMNGHIDSIRELKRYIDTEAIKIKREYLSVLRLYYRLFNLSINPSKYKERFYDRELNEYRYYFIPHLFSKVLKLLENEDEKYVEYIEYVLREVYAIYLELERTKRYGEENQSYPRIGKEYKLIETIKEYLESSDAKVIVATNTRLEEDVLKSTLSRVDEFKEELETQRLLVNHIPKIRNSIFDRSDSILILPGRPSIRDVVELQRPYKEIAIITYEGRPNQSVTEMLNLIENYSPERERKSLEYLREIFDYLGLSFEESPLFKDHLRRQAKPTIPSTERPVTDEVEALGEGEKELDFTTEIKRLISSGELEYQELRDEIEEEEETERSIKEVEGLETEKTENYYLVTLQDLNDNIIERKLFLSKTYLYLKNIRAPKLKILEGTPEALSAGNYLILLSGDVRKTLLDLVVEMSGLEDSIDKSLIEIWSSRLRQYKTKSGLSTTAVYELYRRFGGRESKQTFVTWMKGEVFAPRDKESLRVLGLLMDDEEILENYELIDSQARELRTMHRSVGRKINKIVSLILGNGDVLTSDLALEEYQLYKEIQEHIYEIIEINKDDRHEAPPN